jgi:hypothetical protein
LLLVVWNLVRQFAQVDIGSHIPLRKIGKPI